MRKKVDSRVRQLILNGVNTGQRSMVVIVGDRARDQIVNMHYMLTKAQVKARPSVRPRLFRCLGDALAMALTRAYTPLISPSQSVPHRRFSGATRRTWGSRRIARSGCAS